MGRMMKITEQSDFLGAWMNQAVDSRKYGVPVRGEFELVSVRRKSNYELQRFVARHKPADKDILVLISVPRTRKVECFVPESMDEAGRPTNRIPFDVFLLDTRSESIRLVLESLAR